LLFNIYEIYEVESFIVEDDLNDRRLALHLRQQMAQRRHRKSPITAKSNRLPSRHASCAPNALGAALAIEAHVNDPKSRRLADPLICRANHIHGVPVSAKNIASSAASWQSVAARYSGRIGSRSGPFST
jgi:hypothetical protein